MLLPIGVFIAFALLERFGRGYVWPEEPHWVLRGIIWTVIIIWFGRVFGELIRHHLQPYTLMDLSGLGLWGIIPSLIVYELLIYGYHRALHGVPILWRMHQWHHSSERLDVWSTYRVHPLEITGYVMISYGISGGILGVTGGTAFWTGIVILFIQTIQHTNIKTPVWLSYIIMRPEAHMLHHARDKHHANYSDFPIIDALFGTFEMSEDAPEAVGFWNGASRQIGPLIRGQDVTTPLAGARGDA